MRIRVVTGAFLLLAFVAGVAAQPQHVHRQHAQHGQHLDQREAGPPSFAESSGAAAA